MNSLLLPAAVVVVVLLPMLLLLVAVLTWKALNRRRKRRSPLTSELLRPPAYGLTERIEELRWDLGSLLFAIGFLPLMLLAIYLLQETLGKPPGWTTTLVIYGATLLLTLGYCIVRGIRLAQQITAYRDGRDGEWATAQLLEPVIAGGGRVLHDIQAPGFNIDHVVIAPGGVFAIETKHRLKPTTGRALDNARVSFDGKALHFPDWTDTKTAEQAAAQARWLSERLTKSTGITVKARPVIALPGWYVAVTSPSEVWTMNPKNSGFMLKPGRDRAPLDKADIQRIAFQVEQLCRLPGPDGNADAKGPAKR
ncbi:nuclease-related domain-containing protein [Thiohalocapsa sp. ML1]|uniref:nuclease-related domain-containing protein n=1 Tax=Thiohalocapsa sp. ML1 TaxID=1431688 RepID=UPI00073237F1|nr:nuclease-related domain-containing protein [Thiohalocapsa sp. ML1]